MMHGARGHRPRDKRSALDDVLGGGGGGGMGGGGGAVGGTPPMVVSRSNACLPTSHSCRLPGVDLIIIVLHHLL